MDSRLRLKSFGYWLIRLSERGLPEEDRLDLSGDRDVEWAWIAAGLPAAPGRVLDFGPATSYNGLSAALRGGTVTGLDLQVLAVPYEHTQLKVVAGDILTHDFGADRFDTVLNCSTVEHVGLAGRYGSSSDAEGDLKAMRRLRQLMAGPDSTMVLTVPVGRDGVYEPAHRVYGRERLPRLLSGYRIGREAFFAKTGRGNKWRQVSRDAALDVQGSHSFYALGLFVLHPA